MVSRNTKNITLPKPLLQKEGIVVLPLEKWEKIKEDLEMLQSKKLAKEIRQARKEVKEGKVLTLEEVEKELNL